MPVSNGLAGTGRRKPPRAQPILVRGIFLGPFYVCFVLFFLLPIGYAVYESLFSQRRVGGLFGHAIQAFTGLAQYRSVFSDTEFTGGILRVLIFVAIQVPAMTVVSVGLALLLDVTAPGVARLLRASYFVPYAVSTVVATLMWGSLYTPGISPLTEFHIHWNLLSPGAVIPSIVNVGVWEWGGFNVILMTTALTAIPPEIYEAAQIDGANRWTVAWRIKLPLIRPTVVMAAVLTIIGSLQLFTEPQVMSAFSNSITTYFTPNMLAYSALSSDNYPFAAAISVSLAAVGFVLSFTFLRIVRRRRYE